MFIEHYGGILLKYNVIICHALSTLSSSVENRGYCPVVVVISIFLVPVDGQHFPGSTRPVLLSNRSHFFLDPKTAFDPVDRAIPYRYLSLPGKAH